MQGALVQCLVGTITSTIHKKCKENNFSLPILDGVLLDL